jgi:para-nitrobenzyl esterase
MSGSHHDHQHSCATRKRPEARVMGIALNRRRILQGLLASSAGVLSPASRLLAMQSTAGYPRLSSTKSDTMLAGAQETTAETTSGKVSGYRDHGVSVFKGIPYGASTAGAGRFKRPRRPEPWSGTRSCRAFGPQSPQAARSIWDNDEEGFLFQWDFGRNSEDCLRLNVWTPGLDGKKRPVMFWIHGGGFAVGSGNELRMFDGVNMANHGDVLLITINHRLNVVGYLNLAAYGSEYDDSANAGMLDIVQALTWVRENIAQFGGDPSNVTVFGQSGGGGKICTLMAMPAAQGLFHKAIVESGSMLSIGTEEDSRALAAGVMQKLGLGPTQVSKLQEMPYADLEFATRVVLPQVTPTGIMSFRNLGRRMGLAPIVDGRNVARQPFEPDAPASVSAIPLLVGTTLNEFTNGINHPDAFAMTEIEMQAKVEQAIPGHGTEVVASYRQLYPNSNPFQLWSIVATSGVRESALVMAERKATQPAPVYCYQFNWQTPILDGRPMAFHCSEMPFVFDNAELCSHMTGGGEAAQVLASRVSTAWMNFAKTGNPNHAGLPHWKRFNVADKTTMIFDDRCEAKDNLDTAQQTTIQKARG